MFRDRNENTWRQGHVEDPILRHPPMLNLIEVPAEIPKWSVLIVFARNVRTVRAETGQLVLHLLAGDLDVRCHASQEFRVVHLGSSIADDFDILGEEVVSELSESVFILLWKAMRANEDCYLQVRTKPGTGESC